jgi:hypothetical protein
MLLAAAGRRSHPCQRLTIARPHQTTATNRQGELYKLPDNACSVKDTNGKDGRLDLRPSLPPANKTCVTPCAIAEHGQSGQALWVTAAGGSLEIRAVLSRGPDTGTCGGYDTYTQIDELHFDLMRKVGGEGAGCCAGAWIAVGVRTPRLALDTSLKNIRTSSLPLLPISVLGLVARPQWDLPATLTRPPLPARGAALFSPRHPRRTIDTHEHPPS